MVEQWKEACLDVVPVAKYDRETTGKAAEQIMYEFPDGWSGMFGEERFREGEVWFDPKNYFDQVSCGAFRRGIGAVKKSARSQRSSY